MTIRPSDVPAAHVRWARMAVDEIDIAHDTSCQRCGVIFVAGPDRTMCVDCWKYVAKTFAKIVIALTDAKPKDRPTFSLGAICHSRATLYCASARVSMASFIEDRIEEVLALPDDEQQEFVERVRSRMVDVNSSMTCDRPATAVRPLRVVEPVVARGIDPLRATVSVEVDSGTASIVDDLVTRERELRGRDVSRQSIFEPALIAALNAAEAGAR